jgi:hypothetical protein
VGPEALVPLLDPVADVGSQGLDGLVDAAAIFWSVR